MRCVYPSHGRLDKKKHETNTKRGFDDWATNHEERTVFKSVAYNSDV